ncbi:MAG: glycosyltransferase family 39 protein [Trichodesmium sp. St2_bin6]|nr:glycosyltransferase family 39 protein [Trichodesmium sp. MAG_R01]MDE5073681.1 glycosyltransferase family 39 protein [Trichodesmium sp. St5_bin8]MDE5078356.1 glycosyltransferase family 39 protein [Trichodesmium sp. St2_bin6]MDE5104154.1 glycosyltransferase family 39 protein [Trichodesmium sp. St19_bin2]
MLNKILTKKNLHSHIDLLLTLGLLLAAVVLFSTNLGTLPLRDWDEGIVAQVAREISRDKWNWLYPTINNTPYFNKPPLIHWLIAFIYSIAGVNEFNARLSPALLTAFSVPLIYSIGRELFHPRTPAIFTALVYLTLLPVVRHGRLAMLDGAVVCFFLLMIWCVLRSRQNLRYSLPIGISFALVSLSKGIILGLLLGAIAFLFLWWDTPRLLSNKYFWSGILLGMLPVFLWYTAQFFHYGVEFFYANFFHQSLKRIWQQVGNHDGPIWYYLLEIIKYSFPWQLFWLPGLYLSWKNRSLSWGKLVLIWTGVYLFAISLMNTKLPWYVLPIYPAFALAVGSYITEIWDQFPLDLGCFWFSGDKYLPTHGDHKKHLWSLPTVYHRLVVALFALLAIITWAASVYFSGIFDLGEQNLAKPNLQLQLIAVAVALTMTMVTLLLNKQQRQFLLILIWGTYLSLLMFVSSPYWIWELEENYPVKPVAEMIQKDTPPGQVIYSFDTKDRPSLNFYSDRLIKRVGPKKIQQQWQKTTQPYLLVEALTLNNLPLENFQVLNTVKGWSLVTREGKR